MAVLAIVVALCAPMALYMWWRGHGLRHNLEMAGGTIAVGVLVAVGLAMDRGAFTKIPRHRGSPKSN